MVEEPDTESAISILRELKDKYEFHHKLELKMRQLLQRWKCLNAI